MINSSDPIKIYQIETKPTATAMRGGESISNTKATCSICYFGKYNGKAALVTCGRTNSVGRSIKYGNTTIGSVVKQNLKTFTDVEDYSQYKVKGLVTISGTTVQRGDSGGCVIYTTGAGVNRIAGCITGAKNNVYSYVTPTSYIESSGFSFN